jgi:hypothetical protein
VLRFRGLRASLHRRVVALSINARHALSGRRVNTSLSETLFF